MDKKIYWKQIDDNHWRARVFGGWMVRMTYENPSEDCVWFVPDVDGKWEIDYENRERFGRPNKRNN